MEEERANTLAQNTKTKSKPDAMNTFLVVIAILLAVFAIRHPLVWFTHSRHSLERAIKRGNVEAMTRAIAKGSDVNVVYESGSTPLTTACRYGRRDQELLKSHKFELRQRRIREMLQLLIDSGADINAVDRHGRTALFSATHQPFFGYPKPSPAAIQEHTKLVAMLLDKGANPNIEDSSRIMPLGNAINASFQDNNFQVVELLIKAGADVNVRNRIGGRRLLKSAIEGRDKAIAELLRKHGAKE